MDIEQKGNVPKREKLTNVTIGQNWQVSQSSMWKPSMGAHPTTRYPRRENTQSNKVTMLAAAAAEAGVSVWQMLAWETKSID